MTSNEQTELPRMINKARVRVYTPPRISTYNVRNLKRTGKFYQRIKGCSKNVFDITAIEEHRLQTKSHINIKLQPKFTKFTFYYSSANSSGNGDIGMLVREHIINSISHISKISESILSATFQCNPLINIIATYAPTETSSEQEKGQFYSDLNDSVASIPQHNFVVIAGGSNTRIGSNSHETSPSVIGSYIGHDQANTNG